MLQDISNHTPADGEKTYLARAPVRVDAAGGGSDAPPFCIEQGGAVLSLCIALYVHVKLTFHRQSTCTLRSRDLGEEGHFSSLDDLPMTGRLALLGAIARRMAPRDSGFTFEVSSDAPEGSGLGASGALGVAGVAVFEHAAGHVLSPFDVATVGNAVERVDLGLAGGSQDSYGPAHGGINFIRYRRGGGVEVEPLALPEWLPLELERRCVLVHTGHRHVSGAIHDDIRADYARPDSPTRMAMMELARLAHESRKALLAGDLARWGRVLSENWFHHQKLHPSCCTDRLRSFYTVAGPHVLGGKTCGAGGGGCILFLAKDGHRRILERELDALGGLRLPFIIDRLGLCAWTLTGKENGS